jgi:hypothetical protein
VSFEVRGGEVLRINFKEARPLLCVSGAREHLQLPELNTLLQRLLSVCSGGSATLKNILPVSRGGEAMLNFPEAGGDEPCLGLPTGIAA